MVKLQTRRHAHAQAKAGRGWRAKLNNNTHSKFLLKTLNDQHKS